MTGTYADNQKNPRLTVLTAAQEGVEFIGKRFTLLPDGTISKAAAGNVWRWQAVVRHTPSAEALAHGLTALRADQAITLGTPDIDPDTLFLIGGSIRRTLEHFHHADSQGWLLLDFDNAGMPADVAQRIRELGGVIAALESIWPELKTATRVVRHSSSAGVHRAGEAPPDLSDDVALGRHIFVLLRDQRQAKAALEALTLRAFASGLGWIKLSASGGLLVRSVVDAAVGSPERLVFCGPPDLGDGVTRTAPQIEWQEGDALDAPAPPAGNFAHAEIARLKAAMLTPSEAQRRVWSKTQARKIIAKTGCTAREAIIAVRQRLDGGVLAEHDILQLRDGSETTVAALLDLIEEKITRPGAGRLTFSLPDPQEGAEYGATTATVFWADGFEHPVLISHAHGARAVWRFARYVQAAPKARPVTLAALPDTQTARDSLGAAVAAFTARAEAWAGKGANDGLLALDQPAARPFELMAVHVGTGKTRAAIQAAADLVVRLNAEAARLALAEGLAPHPVGQFAVVYAGPTHAFLDQVGKDFEALDVDGVTTVHLRGPQAVDPAGDGDETMCRDADAFTMASAFLQRPQRVCIGCTHRDGCSYRANQREVGTIYLISHAELGLGRKAPPTLAFRGQTVAALIVDEDATGSLIFGASGLDGGDADGEDEPEPGLVRLSDLMRAPTAPEDRDTFEDSIDPDVARRHDMARQVKALLGFMPKEMQAAFDADSGVRRAGVRPMVQRVREAVEAATAASYDAQRAATPKNIRAHVYYMDLALLAAELRDRNLSPLDLFEAGVREWARRKECDAVRLSAAEYKERVGANLTIRPAQRLYATLATALQAQGWDNDDFDGLYGSNVGASGLCGRVRILHSEKAGMLLRVSGVAALGDGYAAAPTLLLDATAEPEVLPLVWGQTPVVTTIGVAEPRFDVVQDATRAGSKAQLLGYGSATSLHAAKGWRERLARWIVQTTGENPAGALVIGNLDLVAKLKVLVSELAPDAQIAWGHFNNLRGMNDHKERGAVIVIGRTRPKPEDIALTVEALTGAVVADKAQVIAKGAVERLALMDDGSHAMVEGVGVTGEALPLALTRLIESAEVEQALGRLRAVGRQDEDLRAFVLSDVVLARPVRLVTDLWSSVKMAGGVIGAQLDLGDVAFLSAPHAFAAYGEAVGRNLNTAKDAFRRDTIRRDLLAAYEGENAHVLRESHKDLYEESVVHEPFDPRAVGLDPRLFYLTRYQAPRARWVCYALIRVAALGDATLGQGEDKDLIAALIRATAGVEPKDLMLHNAWGPQLGDISYTPRPAKALVIASTSGLLTDLPPVIAPRSPSLSWHCADTHLHAVHLHMPITDAQRHAAMRDGVAGGVTVFNEMLAASVRLAACGPRAA